MSNKPNKRNWNEVQFFIATASMTLSLGLWNMFAGPDRAAARKLAEESATQAPPQNINQVSPAAPTPTAFSPLPSQGITKIMLGGDAPQTQVIVQPRRARGGNGGDESGGGGGGGGGGGSVASTGSS